MNKLRKNVWWLARGLLIGHATLAFIAWFFLPSRIPTHFGLAGNADAWSAPSHFTWFVLLGVSFGCQCLIQLLMSPAARDTWNIPEKEKFLALNVRQQEPVIELMRIFGGFSAACVSLTFLVLHVGVYLTAHGYTRGLPWYIQIGVFGPAICLLVGLIPWSESVRKAILKAASEHGGG